jgi:hypothetical protein
VVAARLELLAPTAQISPEISLIFLEKAATTVVRDG